VELTDFEAMSFDCYGTLIDWETGLKAVLVPWARQRGLSLGGEELLTEYARIEAAAEADHPADPYPDILARSMRLLGDNLGAEVTGDDAARLAGSVPDWPAFPDSHDALTALAGRYQLIILSNVDRDSFAASNRRLGVRFTSILTAQDIGSYKPSLRNFEYALSDLERTFGTKKTDILHTAQSIFHDVVPARTVGLATMWINRRKSVGGWGATPAPRAPGALTAPDIEVASMADFVGLHQAHLRGESA
jgi:2-haloalkanoic acid dehalogenase type II